MSEGSTPLERMSGLRRAPEAHRYAALLALIIGTLIFQMAVPEGGGTELVTILLLSGTFLLALRTSRVRGPIFGAATVIVVAIALGSTIAVLGSGEVGGTASRVVSLCVVAFAPVAITHGIVAGFREQGRITLHTMFGVLCIYLLIGEMFAFAYGVIDDVGVANLIRADVKATTDDYLYFSFTTLTTTGYGDLAAASDVGRSFAITEQLIGQIYLVTVVAVIVGNLGRGAPGRTA